MEDRLEEIERRLKRLEETLFPLERPQMPWPQLPITPMPILAKCPTCGIDWSKPMGYLCPNDACPMQPRAT